MLVFLDGRTNTRARPQENFGREVMELFTWGLGHYGEADVYAAARVFTGWNLRNVPGANGNNDPASYQEFLYNAAQHETAAKTFTFPINGGSNTIPARAVASGMQDGIDFLTAPSDLLALSVFPPYRPTAFTYSASSTDPPAAPPAHPRPRFPTIRRVPPWPIRPRGWSGTASAWY